MAGRGWWSTFRPRHFSWCWGDQGKLLQCGFPSFTWTASFSICNFSFVCFFTLIPFCKFCTCKMNLNDLCSHSPCLHVTTQRPAFSGESATFLTPKMSTVSLWSKLRDASLLKRQTRSKEAWKHWSIYSLCCTLIACSPVVLPIDGTLCNTFVYTMTW